MEFGSMSAINSPRDVLSLSVRWHNVSPGRWEACVNETPCVLVMNDFPDEPLYTATVGGESLDLDDAPPSWSIE